MIGAITSTFSYWLCLQEYIVGGKGYSQSSYFKDDVTAKVQVYSLSLIFFLWSHPHYRSRDFQQDMIDNLRNVAIPGTGIPLSLFCYNYYVCLFFVLFIIPFICFCGAINKKRNGLNPEKSVFDIYEDHLLHPTDWFSFWRLNCRLASLHSLVTKSKGYHLEDKWTFLQRGKEKNIPISPYLELPESLVIKNKNMEGGLGIHFFKNAVCGGDWIIQKKLGNSDWMNSLLPKSAPLSTMRVITSSVWTMNKFNNSIPRENFKDFGNTNRKWAEMYGEMSNSGEDTDDDAQAYSTPATDHDTNYGTDETVSNSTKKATGISDKDGETGGDIENTEVKDAKLKEETQKKTKKMKSEAPRETLKDKVDKYITPLSGVLRLGREGASTDHSSVLFDVDINKGTVLAGTSNSHWYKLGLNNIFGCPWLPQDDGFDKHPDVPGKVVSGYNIPNLKKAIEEVCKSHFSLLPDVPMVGWDLAFCDDGNVLLEVNLSCNFFRGTFDVESYIQFVDGHFADLETKMAAMAQDKKNR